MKKHNRKITNYILLIFIPLLSIILPNKQILTAQNHPSINKKVNQKKFQPFQLPRLPKNGTPTGRRRGGAGRNECPSQLSKIVALVPGFTEETIDKSTLETTASAYPTFWVYVPELPNNARFAEFTLQDIDNKRNIYLKSFVLSGQAGIISFNLPPQPEYSLKTGTKYRWIFTVYCNEETAISEDYVSVDSYIKRVVIKANIKPDDYLTYAENNIWYDSLTKLAQLHRERPKDEIINQDWLDLLTAVNLTDISTAKFIETYNFAQ
ncbi:hypothetical protein NIES2100_28990 [Calothrix sp. NIES-2100]|uniref:DUF928 domain-containing protein n=1 Tax=Calothrix sp. NIES-2100 TaxID=1954172 RepID=UPI000B5DDA8D|nr:hypothetical protein NIES2100_28990 [Calothrix sp. NIES-2100]